MKDQTWFLSTLSRWHSTFLRCLTSALTEQRTNFCCGDQREDLNITTTE